MSEEKKQGEEAGVLMPREDVFGGQNVIESSLMAKGTRFPIYEKTEYPPAGGIYVYYKDHPYPKKGFPFPEAVHATDVVKRITRTAIEAIAGKEMVVPAFGVLILPWRAKIRILERILRNYNRVGNWILSPAMLTRERYCNPAREVHTFTFTFLADLGIGGIDRDTVLADPNYRSLRPKFTAWAFARIAATIFEYDDAYRYRLQDVATETSKNALLENPRREIKRLSAIFKAREKTRAAAFVDIFAKITSIVMLHPRIKKAFRKAVVSTDFRKMRLDNADRYHILLRNDYDFLGRTFEERKKIYVDFHTKSVCCQSGVMESRDEKGGFLTICQKCRKPCEWKQKFPPEVEIK